MSYNLESWRIPEWFKGLTEKQSSLLRAYFDDIRKWSPKVNLVSGPTLDEMDRVHFADSILGLQLFLEEIPQNERVWDLGSGNGFPGVVLSILRPDLNVVSVDSDERKCGFQMQLALRNNIKNLSVKCVRLENCQEGSMKFAVTRALGDIGRLIKLMTPAFVPRGTLFHFKGLEWEKELSGISPSMLQTWKTEFLGAYDLPGVGEDRLRSIVRSQKN